MIIVGCDPGVSGAIAFYDPQADSLDVYDAPTLVLTTNGKQRRELDLHQLHKTLFDRSLVDDLEAIVEKVASMPGQGVASTFTFGRAFGSLEMALVACCIPVSYVRPGVWKRVLRVPADKDGARKRASELLPQHAHLWPKRGHDGRAEAALLAYYGHRFLR